MANKRKWMNIPISGENPVAGSSSTEKTAAGNKSAEETARQNKNAEETAEQNKNAEEKPARMDPAEKTAIGKSADANQTGGKTGIVLEGGGMRGLYTAGILDILMENDIEVEGAVGVSAGAVFGSNYKSRQIGRSIRYNLAYSKDPRYMSFRSLLKTGDYFGADFCYRRLPYELDIFDEKAYAENPMDFYIVCTDVNTGQPVYHLANRGDVSDVQWMRASASMPFFAKAVKLDGYELLDGGVSDSIPLAWFCGQGFTKNIVILTRPAGYRKQPSKLTPLMNLALRKRPALAKAMANRHIMYNEELDEVQRQEKAGTAYVLRPDESIKISRTENDPEKLKALYEYGRKEGERHLEEIRCFLNSNH